MTMLIGMPLMVFVKLTGKWEYGILKKSHTLRMGNWVCPKASLELP